MSDPHKFKIVTAFDGASAAYETAAGLQKNVSGQLAERIARLSLPERARLLEIGCGTGYLTRALKPVTPNAYRIVSDIAPAMTAHCRDALHDDANASFIVMDGEAPAVQGGFDLITASLVFQWFEDLEASLHRLTELLAPGGHLAFATLVQGTFREWHAAHRMFGLRAATPVFPSAAAIDGYWNDNEIGVGSIEEEEFHETYSTAFDFLMALKTIGAATPRPGYEPLPAGSLRRILRHLDEQGSLAITYRVAYGFFTRTR